MFFEVSLKPLYLLWWNFHNKVYESTETNEANPVYLLYYINNRQQKLDL